MLINKIHLPIRTNTNRNNHTKPIVPKTPSFSGRNVEQFNTNNTNDPLVNILGEHIFNQDITTTTDVYRNDLQEKIYKNSCLNTDKKLKEMVQKMVFYTKNKDQLALIDQILTNEKLLNEDFITKIQYTIQAASNPAKQEFVSKVLSNEVLYNNKNLISNLEKILYTDDFENIVLAKISVIDKILSTEILSKNEVFMENIAGIISEIDSKSSADITNSVLDCILNNEKCAQNKQFIGALGKLFATQEFHRRYGSALDEMKKEFGSNSIFASIIGAISYILDPATLNAFEKIMDNQSFLKDENLMIYAPRIVNLTLAKNVDKIENVIKYIKKNAYTQTRNKNEKIIQEYMYYDFESLNETEQFIDIQDEALNKKYQLKEGAKSLSDTDVIDFFDNNKRQIRAAIKLLGKNTFIHSFPSKLSKVGDLAKECYLIQRSLDASDYEELLLKLNPCESKQYKQLKEEIKLLKQQYPSVKANGNFSELTNLQNQINTKTKQAQEIIKNKVDFDPDTKINKTKVIAGLVRQIENKTIAEKPEDYISFFITLLRNTSEENEFIWNRAVSEKIFEKFGMKYDKNVASKINLTSSKYINEIFSADLRFSNGLRDIFNLITNNPEKSVTEVFNGLPSNIKTKELFQKFGIDYDKWVNFDKDSKIMVKFNTLKEDSLEAATRMLLKIFNDSTFHSLPEKLKNNIENALGIEGINLRKIKFIGTENEFKYLLSIQDIAMLKNTIKIIQNELNKDFWSARHPDGATDFAKTIIYNELIKTTARIRELLEIKPDTRSLITIKKVDMNDVGKSLFLGNDASCCTSVGTGAKQWTAPNYVKNKMFSAIEILDGETPIGNTMCYFALVDKQLSLVLDNVEFKPRYRNDNNIRDGIIEYSKQICKEVGVPNIPIYMASHRNQLDLEDYFPDLKNIKIIGNTGDDTVYLDFLNSGDKIDFDSNIYPNAMMTHVA